VADFRLATVADLPVLLDLESAFYAHEGYPFHRALNEQSMRRLIADANLGRLFMIGEGDGYMVLTFGFSIEFGGRDSFVDELYVAPHARGRGLGTEALVVAERACAEAGVATLHLEVEHVNARARALYERHGYSAHDRHLMSKRLTS
jgi:ribosomal protein S18 acetylase RimI-like enzyme